MRSLARFRLAGLLLPVLAAGCFTEWRSRDLTELDLLGEGLREPGFANTGFSAQ